MKQKDKIYTVSNSYDEFDTESAIFKFSIHFEGIEENSDEEKRMLLDLIGVGFRLVEV